MNNPPVKYFAPILYSPLMGMLTVNECKLKNDGLKYF